MIITPTPEETPEETPVVKPVEPQPSQADLQAKAEDEEAAAQAGQLGPNAKTPAAR